MLYPATEEDELSEIRPDAMDRLMSVLLREHPAAVVYVYRLGRDRRRIRPHLMKSAARIEVLEILRDEHGGGEFNVLVREGRTMVCSGNILVIAGRSEPEQMSLDRLNLFDPPLNEWK